MWPWPKRRKEQATTEQGNDAQSSSSSSSPIVEPLLPPPLPPPPLPPQATTPSDRLLAAWRAATARVSPGDPIPPRPPELGEWAANTVLCAGAGAAFCGWREAAATTSEGAATVAAAAKTIAAAAAAETATPAGEKAAAAARARAIAEEKTRRLVRIGSEAIRGAGRFGSLAALFWALQLGAGVARGEQALIADSALAAAFTGGVFGLGALPRGSGARARLRSSLLGAALGAGVAVPAAAVQKVLLGLLPEEQQQKKKTQKQAFGEEGASSAFGASTTSSSSSSAAETILAVAEHLESSMNEHRKK